ncbi:hypothetical protein [Catenulispora sp. MAP5-51]|uniref:hypothetical protein n=1 Tax=Catenulispora sp. MAP5-51 TaxID=3156298 RepID=UPI00351754AC
MKHAAARLAISALIGMVLPVTVPLTARAAAAGPITVNLTVDPPTTTVGGQVTLTATLTNNTSSVTSGALGIQNPDWANQHITSVSAGCRIKVTFATTATGTDDFTAYGRITNVNDEYAYGTLTVS